MQNKLTVAFLTSFLTLFCLLVTAGAAYAGNYYSFSYSYSHFPSRAGYYSGSNFGYYGGGAIYRQYYAVPMHIPVYVAYMANHHDVYPVYAHNNPHRSVNRQHLWVNASTGSPIPDHAVVGGKEPISKQTLYVCRAPYLGGTHPGKLQNGKCTFTYHGNEIRTDRYQLLVSKRPMRWSPASFGKIPAHSILAGRDNGKPLYICQAKYQDGQLPGKVIGEDCHIGYEGRVIAVPHYQVLVA